MIYFLQSGQDGPIKIGFTNSIDNRLSALQVNSPYSIKALGTMEGDEQKEKWLHEQFSDFHFRGEWFWPAKSLLKFIKDNTADINDRPAILDQHHPVSEDSRRAIHHQWLGSRVKYFRKKKKLTQTELGRILDFKSPASVISQLENGQIGIRMERLPSLAVILEVHPVILIVPQFLDLKQMKKISEFWKTL